MPLWRRLGDRRTALVASALVVAAVPLSVAAPSVADSSLPTVSFRVVEPDGSPVVRPTVVVSVFGPTAPRVHVLAGGAAGQVVVPFPADDPVAAAKLAAGDDVNLLIRVFDKPPGSADINAAYVGAAIGVDPWGTLRELSAVTGTTIPLQAEITDFHHVTGRLADTIPPPDPGGSGSVPPYCHQQPEGNAYYCYDGDFPGNAQHVLVPIANNHGAGNDMRSLITYLSTKVTTTSFAVQAGYSGFVQGDGTLAFEKESSTKLEWQPRGPDDNVQAQLDTTFIRERVGWCVTACQIETIYRPFEAGGPTSVGVWALNDRMDTAQDCWTPVEHAFEPTTKSSTSLTFQFRLGPDENWATVWVNPQNPGSLYANTTITQQTHSGTSHIRRWEVAGPTLYPRQYVYLPNGMYGAGTSVPNATCVATHLGDLRTDSEWTDYAHPVPTPTRGPYVDPSDPQDEEEAEAPVCGNMPDRCD